MRLTPEATLFTLLGDYPFLEPYLDRFGTVGVSDSREARRKAGRMITLRHLALLAATPLPTLLVDLREEILRATGEAPELGPVTAAHVDPQRVEALAAIVRDLYEGGDLDDLTARLGALVEHAHGSEFAALGRELANGERGAAEIARLYERHALMFAPPGGAEVVAPAGHPLHTCEAELHALDLAASALRTALERLGPHPSPRTWEALEGTFVNALKRIGEVERHLRRVENLILAFALGLSGRRAGAAPRGAGRAPPLEAGAGRR